MSSTPNSRYQVSHPEYGLLQHCRTKRDAFSWAHHYLLQDDYEEVHVFDLMAKRGSIELWKLTDTTVTTKSKKR